jgi:hypothetical protein
MELKPGEAVHVPFPVPPHVAEAIRQGAVMSFENGPVVETSPRHYERIVEVLLDGDVLASGTIQWDSPTAPWMWRVWRWLRRKPEIHDVRLGA